MLNRRESLRLIAGTAAALWVGDGFGSGAQADQARIALTPEQEEGPFYIGAEHIRRDIRDGKPGVPLHLAIGVMDFATDQPIAGAAVDIWHCDAGGLYSGYTKMHLGPPPGRGPHPPPGGPPPGASYPFAEGGHPPGPLPGFGGRGPHHHPTDAFRFLRGVQVTDAHGVANFLTIYPGWYAGREIHIHLKVHLAGSTAKDGYIGGKVCHTGQLFFPDETNAAVSRLQPYALSTTPRTTKETDHVYREENGERSLVTIRPVSADPAAGYLARIALAVDPTASPQPVGMR